MYLKTFEPNDVGRDFVIGDLHGKICHFNALLQGLNFDKTKDRMFSVGDLVDRGEDSLSCLELIIEPWFHSVKANHELLMREAFSIRGAEAWWYESGGFWGAEAVNDFISNRPPSDRSALIIELMNKTEELPFLITVKTTNGTKVHIMHAELPPGCLPSDDELEDPEFVRYISQMHNARNGPFILWSRDVWGWYGANALHDHEQLVRYATLSKHDALEHNGLSHIISGHTPVKRPMTIPGRTNIDTGAYKNKPWAALSCLEINTWRFYQVKRARGEFVFDEVQPEVINKDEIIQLRTRNEINSRSQS